MVEQIIKFGDTATFIQADIADSLSIKHMIKQTVKTVGAIDFAINNAGIISTTMQLTNYQQEDFNNVITIKEYAPPGIPVNALCSSFTATPMITEIKRYNGKPVAQAIPIDRLGNPEEVATAACWLCLDLAAYTTRVALPIVGRIMA